MHNYEAATKKSDNYFTQSKTRTVKTVKNREVSSKLTPMKFCTDSMEILPLMFSMQLLYIRKYKLDLKTEEQ